VVALTEAPEGIVPVRAYDKVCPGFGSLATTWKVYKRSSSIVAGAIVLMTGATFAGAVIAKFTLLTSKKLPLLASTKTRAVLDTTFGRVTVSVPSFGVFASKRVDDPSK
jgi:hypothetical protein